MDGLADAIREKGLADTHVTDIVRHARASRETFYRCFEDRDACFIALAESTFNSVLEDVGRAIDPNAPWRDQVDQGIEALLKRLDADREVTVTFVNDLPMLGTAGTELRARRNEQYAQLIVVIANSRAVVAEVGDVSYVTIERATFLVAGIDSVVDRAVRAGKELAVLAPLLSDLARRVLAPDFAPP
ncbi:MAG: TetR/AcrR family transcriptional regulator [Solirubrobacterales bacterium]